LPSESVAADQMMDVSSPPRMVSGLVIDDGVLGELFGITSNVLSSYINSGVGNTITGQTYVLVFILNVVNLLWLTVCTLANVHILSEKKVMPSSTVLVSYKLRDHPEVN